TATIQMAVVPEGVTSLADPAVTGNFESAANFYATLLRSPQATFDIATDQGAVFTDPINVSVLQRTGIMSLTVTASDPGGAERAALGSFRWLEARLADRPVIAALPGATEQAENVDDDLANVVMSVDPLYAGIESDLFITVSSPRDPGFRLALGDAALSARAFPLLMPSDREVTVGMETSDGTELGFTDIDLAEVGTSGQALPPLIVTIDEGAVTLDEGSELTFVGNRVNAQWDLAAAAAATEGEAGQLSVMLLNDVPIVGETGLRRVPILVGAPIIAGILVLLATATVIDRYRQLKREHAEAAIRHHEIEQLERLGVHELAEERLR
ncbi:MAG: hypothetical protein ACFCVC_14820, partial [Acidimicrobiia bacterium]